MINDLDNTDTPEVENDSEMIEDLDQTEDDSVSNSTNYSASNDSGMDME